MPFDGVEVSEVTERLVIGRARIEAGWCQKHYTRVRWTLHGRRREYCLMGAVTAGMLVPGLPPGQAFDLAVRAEDLLVAAIVKLGYGWIEPAQFNDSHTRDQVLEVLDLAIAMSRGELHVR